MNEHLSQVQQDCTPTAPAVNVLTLGAKNDGSEDVSALVNHYTKEFALFFPAGQYKVSHPLVIENPIYGVGYSRNGTANAAHTFLISDIKHSDTDPLSEVGVITFGGNGNFVVENLNIRCADHECGIYIDPCVQGTSTFVNKVGIFNVRGYGLLATKSHEVPGFASRPLFLQNMTILGTADHPYPSIGIQTGERIGDNRMSNIEIMGTRVGIMQEASFVYATNLHIWTGCLSQRDNGQWWETTRGIILGHGDANFLGDNVYLDTSYALVEMNSPLNMLSIHNFMSWEDGSIAGCDKKDARLFLLPDDMTEYPYINLTNGLVFVSGHDGAPGKIADLTSPAPNSRIENVRILSRYSVNRENYKRLTFLRKDTPSYNGTAPASETEQYVRIASVVAEAENGFCKLTYTDNSGDHAVFTARKKHGKLALGVKRDSLCEHDFYVRHEDGFFTLFVRTSGGESALSYGIDTETAAMLFFPLDLGILKDHPSYAAKTEILTSPEGLTKVEEE